MANRLDSYLKSAEKAERARQSNENPLYGGRGKTKKQAVPLYDKHGRTATPSVLSKRRKIRTIAIALAAVIMFLYLPGFFMGEPEIKDDPVVADTSAIRLSNSVLRSSPDDDFDGDKLTNGMEMEHQTNPWNKDTDNDGLVDSYEINEAGSDPVRQDNNIIVDLQTKLDKEKGKTMSSPYMVEGVILWADDYVSKARGGIVETKDGSIAGDRTSYHVNGFNGYAQFPKENGSYAYCVENGIHTLLPYREEENVWYIQDGQDIEVFDKKLEDVVRLSFFGKHTFLKKSWASGILEFILPEKGILSATSMTRIDAEPDTSEDVLVEITRPGFDSNDTYRFTVNTTTVKGYQYVLDSLEKKKSCIAVSLYNKDRGEYKGIIYGFNRKGDLYVADMNTMKHAGLLRIQEKANKIVNDKGDIEVDLYFDFYGLGFSSTAGDRISFFAGSSEK